MNTLLLYVDLIQSILIFGSVLGLFYVKDATPKCPALDMIHQMEEIPPKMMKELDELKEEASDVYKNCSLWSFWAFWSWYWWRREERREERMKPLSDTCWIWPRKRDGDILRLRTKAIRRGADEDSWSMRLWMWKWMWMQTGCQVFR